MFSVHFTKQNILKLSVAKKFIFSFDLIIINFIFIIIQQHLYI